MELGNLFILTDYYVNSKDYFRWLRTLVHMYKLIDNTNVTEQYKKVGYKILKDSLRSTTAIHGLGLESVKGQLYLRMNGENHKVNKYLKGVLISDTYVKEGTVMFRMLQHIIHQRDFTLFDLSYNRLEQHLNTYGFRTSRVKSCNLVNELVCKDILYKIDSISDTDEKFFKLLDKFTMEVVEYEDIEYSKGKLHQKVISS